MSSKKSFLILKAFNFNFWKNNYLNINNYSNFFFQLNLLKNIIYFFFLNSISCRFLKKKKTINNIYISQIWINSINNILILSFNIYSKKNYIKKKILQDNYLRLKYFYTIIFDNIIV